MRSLTDCRLYGILDLGYVKAAEAEEVTKAMIRGGVDLIQLRGKDRSLEELSDLAGRLHPITKRAEIPLLANDHVELARRVPLEGVHVGQGDESVAVVRAKAGRPILVGKSTHSLGQASEAADEKPDYIGFGPLFATPTKPDYSPIGLAGIKEVHGMVKVPIFCIGGVKLDNLREVMAAGARRVVIVSGLLQAPDIAKYAQMCKEQLSSGSRASL